MKPIKQKSLYNGRNEVTAPGAELTSDTPEAGQAGRFFCSSILPQFLARTQTALGVSKLKVPLWQGFGRREGANNIKF